MKKAVAKPIIAVDVDDVLVPTNEAIRVFVNENFGTNFSIEDHNRPGEFRSYFESIWEVDDKEAELRYSSFIHSDALMRTEPLDGSIETIAYLKKNYDLVIISARHEDQVEMTHQWLLKHFPAVFSDIRIVSGWHHGHKVTKAEVCLEIGASYLIDDNVEHCTNAEHESIKSLLFGVYGWNKHDKDAEKLTKVKNWAEVKKFFDEERTRSV